jgi:UDP-glucose 4-epimerase
MVGSTLCQRLERRGDVAIPVDRARNAWDASLDARTMTVELLRDPYTWALPRTKIDVVVHCAANARVHDLVVRPELALDNVITCAHALEYAREVGAAFVFTSSREVYGNQGLGTYREGDVQIDALESPYAASKLAGEHLAFSYRKVYGLPVVVVRLSNVYGRNDLTDRFVPTAIRNALSGTPLPIYGAQKRLDFTYLDDTVSGLLAALDHIADVDGEVVNIASGRGYTLVETAERVGALLGRPLTLVPQESRPGEVVDFQADISKARRMLGYEPATSLEDGLTRTVEWYRHRLAPAPASSVVAGGAPSNGGTPR